MKRGRFSKRPFGQVVIRYWISVFTFAGTAVCGPFAAESGARAAADPLPICPFILRYTVETGNWIRGAPWVKVLDVNLIQAGHDAGCKVFFRPYYAGDDGDTSNGASYGASVLSVLNQIPQSEWPEAITYRNEFFNNDVTPYEFIPYYDALRAGGYEGIICFGSYGVGWPEIAVWGLPQVRAAVEKADAIDTHEYFDLTCAYWDTWLAHRHVRAINSYPYLRGKPWFIGEMGSDRAGNEDPLFRRGWRDGGKLSEEEYITQLGYYINGGGGAVPCADQVVACFIFQLGNTGDWWDFDIWGTSVADWLRTTWPVVIVDTPTPTPTVTWTPYLPATGLEAMSWKVYR